MGAPRPDLFIRTETCGYAAWLAVSFTIAIILPLLLLRAILLFVLLAPSYEYYEFVDGVVFLMGSFKYAAVVLIAGLTLRERRTGFLWDEEFSPDGMDKREQFFYQLKHHTGAFCISGGVYMLCVAYFFLAQNDDPAPSFRSDALKGGLMGSADVLMLLSWMGYWMGRRFYYERLRLAAPASGPQQPVRGERLLSDQELFERTAVGDVRGQAEGFRGHLPRRFHWGGHAIDERLLGPHYCVIGNTGSGKTLSMRLFMQTVFAGESRPWSRGVRAVVYDPKRDFFPLLVGMGVSADLIHVMNPFDMRCEPWAIDKDTVDEASAGELAKILAPEEENAKDRYWPEVARECISAVVLTLIKRAKERGVSWTLRDVVEICTQRKYFEAVLGAEPEGRRVLDNHFRGQADHTAASIVSTFSNKLAAFRQIAALWDSASKPALSLTEWIDRPGIVLLGNNPKYPGVTEPLNRVLMQRLGALVRAKPENPVNDETWFFLDEVRGAGKFEGLPALLTEGRSKGCHVFLNFQDKEGWESVYGDKVAREMISQCDTKGFNRLGNPSTSEYSSQVFGQYEDYIVTENDGLDAEGKRTTGTSRTLGKIDVVLPQEFMNLRPASSGHGFEGFYLSAKVGRWRWFTSRDALNRGLAHKVDDAGMRNFEPRPDDHQQLATWERADFARFGIDVERRSPTEASSTSSVTGDDGESTLMDW